MAICLGNVQEIGYFEQLAGNLKYANIPKRGKRVMIGLTFNIIFLNNIVQNYHKHYPPKGVRVVNPNSMETESA